MSRFPEPMHLMKLTRLCVANGMAQRKTVKTSFDLFVDILKMEKDECTSELYKLNTRLEKMVQQIEKIESSIQTYEEDMRRGADQKGQTFHITNYELIRNNISELRTTLGHYRQIEKKLRADYEAQLAQLQEKVKSHNKVTEKQAISREEIRQGLDKKEQAILDDMWLQNNWENLHG